MNKRTERSPRGDRKTGGPRKAASGKGPQKSSSKGGPRGARPSTEGRERPASKSRGAGKSEWKERGGAESRERPASKSRGPGKGGWKERESAESRERPASKSRTPGKSPWKERGSAESQRPAENGRSAGKGEWKERGSSDRPAPTYKGKGPGKPRAEKPWKRQSQDERTFKEGDPKTRRPFRQGERSNRFSLPNPANEGLIRLNKYLANAGVGSRREADELITTGVVTVNGKIVTELGTKVMPTDIIHFGGQKLSIEQKRYVLMNKPKDTITTTDDPRERHTVMDLIAKACTERLYPVGRLDRNTTGVLLLTNDGDLAKKLTHPSHGAEKMYHVTLDKSVQAAHLHELVAGVHLDDGPAQADEANYVAAAEGRREVGVKLHMGRNRIVRRMFEALGYEVVKLDRVMFAGLTKKDLQRGHWRHLSEKEVTLLKRAREAPQAIKGERGGKRLRISHGSE